MDGTLFLMVLLMAFLKSVYIDFISVHVVLRDVSAKSRMSSLMELMFTFSQRLMFLLGGPGTYAVIMYLGGRCRGRCFLLTALACI